MGHARPGTWSFVLFFFALAASHPAPALAQIFEATGERALGMGGAFVAVADDGTATYWNPAGLATGRTAEVGFGRARVEAKARAGGVAAAGLTGTSFYAGMPAFGFSINSLRGTEGRSVPSPTGTVPADRQDLRPRVAGVSALTTRQFGVSLVQSLLTGVVVGATLKYVRGTAATGDAPADATTADLLSRASSLAGRTGHAFDADLGVMASVGSWKAGMTARNLAAPAFETADGRRLHLQRQVRVGLAVTPGREAVDHASQDGWVLALDADLTTTSAAAGRRRMLALGAERWGLGHRVGLRAGGRISTAGTRRAVATAGISLALRAGLFLDAHVAGGGDEADRGWGVGARAGF